MSGVSEDDRLRFKSYLKNLGVVIEPSNSLKIRRIAQQLATKTVSSFIFSGLSINEINYLFGCYLVAVDQPEYIEITISNVIDITCQNYPRYKSIDAIGKRCLLLWGGYHEYKNPNMSDYVLDCFDRRSRLGYRTCLALNKGRFQELEKALKEYPDSICLQFDNEDKGDKHD